MGLDDFMSESDSKSSGTDLKDKYSKAKEKKKKEKIDNEPDSLDETELSFYGGESNPGTTPMEREGALSDFDYKQVHDKVDGTIESDEDLIKYHCAIFTIITRDGDYNIGERYKLKYTGGDIKTPWHNRVVSCMGTIETELGKVHKETVMFEVGSNNKKHIMERMNKRTGDDVDAHTKVNISFFGDSFQLRDLAQANETFKAGKLLERSKIGKRVILPKMLRIGIEREEKNKE